MKVALTMRNVDAAKPAASPYEIRDRDINGLLLRVQPSGITVYYVELARGIRVQLGRHPVLTLQGARLQGLKHLSEYAQTGERPASRASAKTFGDFIKTMYGPWVVAERKTGARTVATLQSQFAGLLGKRLKDVSAWAVEKWKSSRLKEGINPATVNRDLVRVKAALA